MNIVPFIDICLVLVVIFMISSIVDRSSISVQLPKAEISHSASGNNAIDTTLIISIDNNGEVFATSSYLSILDRKINPADLRGLLELLTKDSQTSDVFIRADADTKYQTLISILSECKNSGHFNVKLVTDNTEDK